MYGLASVEQGEYKKFADSVKVSFKLFQEDRKSTQIEDISQETSGNNPPSHIQEEGSGDDYTDEQVEKAFQGFINEHELTLSEDKNWYRLELKSSALFESGSAKLSLKAVQIIDDIAEFLKTNVNRIQVEGHTDIIPISNEYFPSNWELSTARAAAVVRELIEAGIDPKLLAAVGYAAIQPKDSRNTEAAHEINRRVVIAISKQSDKQFNKNFESKIENLLSQQPKKESDFQRFLKGEDSRESFEKQDPLH